MSRGNTRASSNSASSDGTTSTRSLPGCTTPPTVLTLSCLIVPFTGDLISVCLTRSSSAELPSSKAFSFALVSLSSDRAMFRKVNSTSWILRLASATADSNLGMSEFALSRSPR